MSETMFGTGMWALWMLVMAAAVILPFWFIFPKAGYSKWLTLLMVVPPVNAGIKGASVELKMHNWRDKASPAG